MVAHRWKRSRPLYRPVQFLRCSRYWSVDVACYNNPVKNFLLLAWPFLVLILLLSIFLAYAAAYSYEKGGINAYLGFAALLIAIATLCVTALSLNYTSRSLALTTRDINARVRPFLSIGKINGEFLLRSQETPGPNLVEVSLSLHNTGSVPATQVNVTLFLKEIDSDNILDSPTPTYLSALQPNVSAYAIAYYPPQDPSIQQLVNSDKTLLQVFISYTGIDHTHISLQTFRIEHSLVPYRNRPIPVGCSPVDPTCFC